MQGTQHENKTTMRAAILRELQKPVYLSDVPVPGIGRDEVLVEMKACGICATDLHIMDGMGYKPQLPHILGHEPSGVVSRIGEDVKRVKPGDRVIPNIFFTCGECYYCRTNRETLCQNFKGLGVGTNGGYAEYFKAQARNLFKLPDNIGFEEGSVIADAVVTAVHAVRRRAQVKSDDLVLINGIGGVGQSVIQVSRKTGAKTVALGRNQPRLDVAKRLGADYVVNSRERDVIDFVKDLTSGSGVDIVIDNVGTRESVAQGISLVRPGGRVVMVGETDETIPISTFQLCTKEYEIIGSRSGGRQDTVEAIELVEEGTVTPFISDKFPLERINEAFERVKSGNVLGRAVVLGNNHSQKSP